MFEVKPSRDGEVMCVFTRFEDAFDHVRILEHAIIMRGKKVLAEKSGRADPGKAS